MSKSIVKKRKPPARVARSPQYDLFAEFFGEPAELSNTIELWDAIPKYAVNRRRQSNARDAKGRLPVHEYRFVYSDPRKNEHACRIAIQPASIETEDGFVDFYPSQDEELVEEVIRKIFADQNYGIHDASQAESWVKFSLSMIRRELKTRGRTRSIDEIKRSIEILANTTIRLYVQSDKVADYTVPILSDLTRVTRTEYLDDPKAMWVARLPALVSKSVNELTYRQFNYGTLMGLDTQLARWLHKRLSHRYINAGFNTSYDVLYSTLKAQSGLLEADSITKSRRALEKALDQLKEADVLLEWTAEERRGAKNRIDDILYSLQAHPTFSHEVKTANARRRDHQAKLEGRPTGGQGGRRRATEVVGGRQNK
jgi:hypothetical protein